VKFVSQYVGVFSDLQIPPFILQRFVRTKQTVNDAGQRELVVDSVVCVYVLLVVYFACAGF